jgi:5-methyltetrahydrofolate--homocysteine methyltransferase
MTVLHDLVQKQGYAVIDGATGTELFKRGLESGYPPEAWNTEHPDRIQDAYSVYVQSGSDIFLTNSFGGTHYRLALHNLQDRVLELNEAAARLAREVADQAMSDDPDRTVLVAGSMGPTGELLAPMGDMTMDACQAAFADQALGLAKGGADLLWIETISSLDEAEAAVAGARQSSDLPIVLTMSFDTAGRTMMGVTGTQLAELATRLGVDGVGANCGNNITDTLNAVGQIREANADILTVVKANAGIPEWRGSELFYSGSPDIMGAYAHRAHEMGINVIGGCCGSEPAHIAKMSAVLSGADPVPDVDPEQGSAPAAAGDSGEGRRGGRRRRARGSAAG